MFLCIEFSLEFSFILNREYGKAYQKSNFRRTKKGMKTFDLDPKTRKNERRKRVKREINESLGLGLLPHIWLWLGLATVFGFSVFLLWQLSRA